MDRHKKSGLRRGLTAAAAAAVVALLSLAACGSAEDSDDSDRRGADSDATTGDDTTTSSAANALAALYPEGLRDVRYCEILLVNEAEGRTEAQVWNTLGINECPSDEWVALDVDAIASERGALAAVANGPRYWTLDWIESEGAGDRETTTFGDIEMFRAAVVDLGEGIPDRTPYTERFVERETVFSFRAGSEIYELTDPAGTVYVMQAYSQIVDPGLNIDDLSALGATLQLPDGWSYSHRIVEQDLDLLSTDGVATVVQDELQNTYQRDDT